MPHRRRRCSWAVRALVVVVFLVGCTAGGRPIRAWTLDAPAGPHGVSVTLPGSLMGQLGLTETTFTLRTTVDLDVVERGRLTLGLSYTRVPLALSVDGKPAEKLGASGVGEQRFVFDAAGRSTLTLELSGRYWLTSSAIEVAPVLEIGTAGPPPAAVFNRYSNLVAAIVAGIVGFLYLVLSVLDRRRREYRWVASASLAGPVIAAQQVGLIDGWASLGILMAASAVTFLGVIEIAYHVFDWGRPPRRWWVILAVYCGLIPLVVAPIPVAGVATLIEILVSVIVFLDLTVRLGRVVTGHGPDAWFVLVAYAFAAFANAAELITAASGKNPLSGVHLFGAESVVLSLAMLTILGRQHVSRTRALDKAADELQRQVAARSKDLAEALAQLATKPRPEPAATTVIDGRYRVLRRLGAGGMGSVHEVERISDAEKLALKRIRGHADADVLARFAREAQIAAELRHPNLVPVIDVGVADGELFLVMPVVDGGSLVTARARYGDLPWAKKILREIAIGLAALHERGIVHRDLKPGNVLIDGGVARIADFGLAYFATRRDAHDTALASTVTGMNPVTRIGDVFGTPPYMAPELINGVHAAGPDTDVFSVGVIAFELVTTRFPFREAPLVAAMAGRTPVPADTSSIDPSLRPIVERCLSFDAKTRPTAHELVELLA
jgi:hypothetical protein